MVRACVAFGFAARPIQRVLTATDHEGPARLCALRAEEGQAGQLAL